MDARPIFMGVLLSGLGLWLIDKCDLPDEYFPESGSEVTDF